MPEIPRVYIVGLNFLDHTHPTPPVLSLKANNLVDVSVTEHDFVFITATTV